MDEKVWSDRYPPDAKPPRKYPTGARLVVGFILSFVVLSLFYGPGMTFQALAFITICTAGIGLIPILLVSWMVGWVVLAVWSEIAPQGSTPSAT